MKTIKELELSLIVKEAMIQQLKLKNNQLEVEKERLNKELNNYRFRPKTRFRDVIELRDRINKAIEYLKDECLYDEEMKCYCDDLFCNNVKELVDILKGVDKE